MVIKMNKYALINDQNIVDNIVLWDGESLWTSPPNLQLVKLDDAECSIGWIYDGSVFTAPEIVVVEPIPEPTPTKDELMQQLQDLSAKIQALT